MAQIGDLIVTGVAKFVNTPLGVIPVGTVVSYSAKSSTPTGWLLCDGSAISRTTYSALYAIIGTTYGTGDGSTTFNLPNGESTLHPSGMDYVVETGKSSDGTRWYRLWKSGWLEQGGFISMGSTVTHWVTLLKQMKDTNYNILSNNQANTSTYATTSYIGYYGKSTTGFYCQTRDYNNEHVYNVNWYTCGQAATTPTVTNKYYIKY